MAAQAILAAKTVLTVITHTGTAFNVAPRGKDDNNVLLWVNAGATSLDDVKVDFSYRIPTATRKTTKALLRTFSPKTFTDAGTGLIAKVGDNIASTEFTFLEAATAAERQKVVDIHMSVMGLTEIRSALISGDVPY